MTRLTLGQRAAEVVASRVGSWPFIIIQTVLLAIWVAWNADAPFDRWDVYPFVFLNLMLSFQAAYTGPIVMIAQNRADGMARETLRQIYGLSRAMVLMLEDWAACIKLLPTILDEVRALRREIQQREICHAHCDSLRRGRPRRRHRHARVHGQVTPS